MTKELICQFKLIKINVPQKLIIKCFYKRGRLTPKESLKISQKLRQIEHAQNQLAHLHSLVDKLLLRAP